MTERTDHDDAKWKRRFFQLTAVRFAGVATIALGLGVAFSDYFFPGGNRLVGALLIVAGTVDSAFGPVLLKRAWRDQE